MKDYPHCCNAFQRQLLILLEAGPRTLYLFNVMHWHRNDGRIPLQDLIRFKERQWFVEELEVGCSCSSSSSNAATVMSAGTTTAPIA
jgi:hypothetical protein